jgi:hypothetical protein
MDNDVSDADVSAGQSPNSRRSPAGGASAPVRSGVVLICGAPCSGKSSLARQLARPGDLVLDRDEMARRLGSPRLWMHEYRYGVAAEQWMQRELRRLAWGTEGRAYVVRCLARGQERRELAATLRADVRVLDPGEEECVHRAVVACRPHGTIEGIRNWYRDFRMFP